MGRLKLLLLLVFPGCVSFAAAQPDPVLHLKPEKTIPGNYAAFYVDNLGNFYVLNKEATSLKKLSSGGDSITTFDNVRRYGNIYAVDVSNPLKIMAYYKDFATIVVLDRFLNAVNTIDLRKSGILQAQAVAASYDNQFWVYDQQAAKIKKIDAQGNIIFASNDLRTVFPDAINPSRILDNNGLLYLYDVETGWYIFDYYGGFKKHIAYKNWQDVSVVNGFLFGREGGRLWMYDPKKFVADTLVTDIDINFADAKEILVSEKNVYFLNKEGITDYLINR